MPRHEAEALVPHTPQQMFDLVVDMDSYPQFLPWCVKARKFDETDSQFMAEMTVSFKGMRETFRTLDRVEPPGRIAISLHSGPFSRLENEWRFTAAPGGTRVAFFIDFEFKKKLLNLTMGPLFSMVTKKMVSAFRERAVAVYGPGAGR